MTVTNLTAPVITGTPRRGQVLVTTSGTWDWDEANYDLDLDYQWMRCDSAGANCVEINGAQSSSYRCTASDIGSRLKSKIRATEIAPSPPPPTNPESPITVAAATTYTTRYFRSTSTTPAVTVNTSGVVTFENCTFENTNLTGRLVWSVTSGNRMVFRNCTFIGPVGGVGRAINTGDSMLIDVQNCTFIRTGGIGLQTVLSGGTVYVARNIATNIWSSHTGDPLGLNLRQFLQLNGCANPGSAIAEWNQVINEFGNSLPEDVFSAYSTNRLIVRNNYIQGNYPRNAGARTSGTAILLADVNGNDNAAHDNQIVACINCGIGVTGGHGNRVYNNRILSTGKLPDGSECHWANAGVLCWDAYSLGSAMYDNRVYDNYVGAMQGWNWNHFARNDGYVPKVSNNWNADNEFAYGNHSTPIAPSDEVAEWGIWQAKLAAAGIALGA